MRLKTRRNFVLLLVFGLTLFVVYVLLLTRDHNCSSRLQCLIKLPHSDKNLPTSCVLPKLDPFDQSIRHLIKIYSDDVTEVCGKSSKAFQLVNGKIKIRESSLLVNISKKSVKFETIIRPKSEDNRIMYGDKVFIFRDDRKVESDFVKVSYKLKNGIRKVEMFAQIVEKTEVLKRMAKSNKARPNIVLMGFDSTSNANFKRKLKRSFRYLVEKLDAYIFNGYTVIGDGTTPALTAILTGNLLSTMPENIRSNLSSWPWIMTNYIQKGYVTLYAEDDPQVASFQKFGGFTKSPSDHYIRPFWLAVERHGIDGRRRNKSASLHRICLNNEPLHNITLNYVKDFLDVYHGMPKFAFPFFSYLPHGTGEKLSFADKDLLLFLKSYATKHRNNSILILYGDHGARVGRIRNTIQGTYEEHLPWLSIVLPSWFKQKYPIFTSNLRDNQDRLTSPIDLHYTLHQFLNLDRKTHATSLMTKLKPERTCREAGVTDAHWCPCLRWQQEDIQSVPIKRAAKLLVNYINKIISTKRIFINLCFTLYLVEIIFAARAKSGAQTEDGIVYYQVTIATKPGDGNFQGTFLLYPDSKMVMTSHVSRTNMYGRHPWCLGRDFHFMRRFCTCKVPYSKHIRLRKGKKINKRT